MKPVERFFRKYFLSMVGIIALFMLLNVVLLFSVLIWAWQTSEIPEISISKICDSITLDGTGHLTAAGELGEILKEHHAWAMILDDTGTVIFQSKLPEELPRQYTVADVAKFSRWYLGDYPVYVQEHPQGLLVVGGETGSLPEKGDLAAINRQLNKAGAFIAKKDSARADWISGVSHDVRTPLSVILGFAGQL